MPPTSALPRAATSFAPTTDNSQDCPLNASRHPFQVLQVFLLLCPIKTKKLFSSYYSKIKLPISFVWFFPPRLYRTQVKMLGLWKTIWAHFDLAILYKALFPLREAPSVPSKVSYSHYATPLWAKKNGASPSRRTAYQSGHTHAVVATATPIPSCEE